MWIVYIGMACLFIFLSQLSGLPQAMFYHLHWAVALPMAFMGFLVLVPGLIKEILIFLIWPLFRPFVQLSIEAVGFVDAESDSQDAVPHYAIDSPPTIIQTMASTGGTPRHTPFQSRKASRTSSPEPALPLAMPRKFGYTYGSVRPSEEESSSAAPCSDDRLASKRDAVTPGHTPCQSRQASLIPSSEHSLNNLPIAMPQKFGYTYGSIRPSKEEWRSASTSSDDISASKRGSGRILCTPSSSETEEEEMLGRDKVEERRRKRLDEQYEMAIQILTPVIRDHVRRYKSNSPDKRKRAMERIKIAAEKAVEKLDRDSVERISIGIGIGEESLSSVKGENMELRSANPNPAQGRTKKTKFPTTPSKTRSVAGLTSLLSCSPPMARLPQAKRKKWKSESETDQKYSDDLDIT